MNFYLGQIVLFAGDFAPKNFLTCSGQTLSIAQNQALFAILGTTYGGNGVSTFQLPDLRGSVMVSPGQGPGRSNYTLGQAGGTENVTLTINNLPSHTHVVTAATVTVNASDGRADATSPNGAALAQQSQTPVYASASDGTKMSTKAATLTVTVNPAGGNQPVPILSPYLTLNYCICTSGLFPSRN
jgi:microcystin-dependent protein